MVWLVLAGTIVSEVIGTLALRWSDGFSRPLPALVVVVGYALSFWGMALVMKQLPVSTTYAVWSGVGTAVTAVAGAVLFAESLGALKVAGIATIIAGVVLLNAAGAH